VLPQAIADMGLPYEMLDVFLEGLLEDGELICEILF
jgi:NH3-dependent NAD+ synthetase